MLKQQKYIIRSNNFRIIEAEVNKTRRIRSKKISKLTSTFDILLLLNKISRIKLPTMLNMVIVKEYLGMDIIFGCGLCKRANKSLDAVISHNIIDCKYTNPNLQCMKCTSRLGYVCISHKTNQCYHDEDEHLEYDDHDHDYDYSDDDHDDDHTDESDIEFDAEDHRSENGTYY